MNITECIIDIKGSTLADRLRLRQVLMDNEIEVISGSAIFNRILSWTSLHYSSPNDPKNWGGSTLKANISLQDFIAKFKKQDILRNLAIYKQSGEPWEQAELDRMYEFVGTWANGTISDGRHTNMYFYDDGCKFLFYHIWSRGRSNKNLTNCLQVAYEDLFPKTLSACSPEPTQTQTTQKENTMDKTTLKLLLTLMGATTEEPKDATNSQYIGILTEDDEYIGYVYADTLKEMKEIIAKRENEGRTIHTFEFYKSYAQAPRPIIEVKREAEIDLGTDE